VPRNDATESARAASGGGALDVRDVHCLRGAFALRARRAQTPVVRTAGRQRAVRAPQWPRAVTSRSGLTAAEVRRVGKEAGGATRRRRDPTA